MSVRLVTEPDQQPYHLVYLDWKAGVPASSLQTAEHVPALAEAADHAMLADAVESRVSDGV